ncbi:hypothetical protein D2A34_07355 [Clostridium chromiireducens]|uniref:O-antigen ligase domain-containing protein n=1 Tax=Clostridium chromiireducens TaxID=225345 RepID=A0A399IW65_9CLOT|nr:hypothetical protein [Clostridium chromiireducens]RII35016.1 hypothetical protein D2A34_07355 [Clostridium chromiireducens]
MNLSYSEKVKTDNKFINYNISIFIFLLLFEILIRAVIPGVDTLMNIFKIAFSTVFIVYIIVVKRKFNNAFKMVHMIFWMYFFIVLMKLFIESNINDYINWLLKNNNINFYFCYIYFIIFSQLRDEIDINKLFKVLKIYNYIIITISFILYMTNNYIGMVSNENMLAYAWVGTDKLRMMSIFGNPNHAGLYFIIMLCILDYFRIKEGKKFICINNVLLVICNLLTFSRTSIICLIIYLYIRNKITFKGKKNKGISNILNKYKLLMFIIITLITVYIVVDKYNIYFFNLNYLLTSSRGEKWVIGLQYMLTYIAIGTPFSDNMSGMSESYSELTFSDNMFIEIGARFGIYLMIVVIIYIMYLLIKSIKNKKIMSLNKLQLVIIPSMLSGTVHFSIPVLLFSIYAILCEDLQGGNSMNDKSKVI